MDLILNLFKIMEKIPLTLADSGVASDFRESSASLLYSLDFSMVLALTSLILLSFLALDTEEERLQSPNVREIGQGKGTCLFSLFLLYSKSHFGLCLFQPFSLFFFKFLIFFEGGCMCLFFSVLKRALIQNMLSSFLFCWVM